MARERFSPQQPDRPVGDAPPATSGGYRKLVLFTGAAASVLLVAALGAYFQRARLASGLAERYLASRGIDAEVRLDRLDTGGVAGRVRIGQAFDPELVVERVEVDFDRSPGAPLARVASVRLDGVKLHLRLVRGKLAPGPLQTVIDSLPKLTASGGGPAPDIALTRARIALELDGHRSLITGDAVVRKGRLETISVAGEGDDVVAGPWAARVRSVRLRIARKPDGFVTHGEARLDLTGLEGPSRLRADGVGLTVDAMLPDVSRPTFDGPLHLDAEVTADALERSASTARRLRLRLGFNGSASGALAHIRELALSGDITGKADVGDARLDAMSQPARISGARMAFAGPLKLLAGGITGTLVGGVSASGGLAPVDAVRLARATPLAGTDPALQRAVADALGGQRLTLERLVLRVSPGHLAIDLPAPAVLAANSGATLTVRANGAPVWEQSGWTPGSGQGRGGAAITLTGGALPTVRLMVRRVSIDQGRGAADVALDAALSYGGFRDITLQVPAHLAWIGSRMTATVAGCAPVTLGAVAGRPADLARRLSGQFCPEPGVPALAMTGAGWSIRGRLQSGEAELPGPQLRVADLAADAAFEGGRREGVTGRVAVTQARVSDAAGRNAVSAGNPVPERFRPLAARGEVRLESGLWNGRFEVVDGRRGALLAVATLTHDQNLRAGSVAVVTDHLQFKPDGLQPGDLSEAAGRTIWHATGEVGFTGRFAWQGDDPVTSSGHASVRLGSFRLGAGEGDDLRTELDFTSLAPLTSAADQVATIAGIRSVTPVSGIEAHYRLTPTTVEVASAVAHAASGQVRLDPMSLLLQPRSSARGQLRVVNVDIGALLSSTDIADKVSLSAVVAGVVPFTMTPEGLRVANGRLASVGPGRLSIRRDVLAGGAGAATGQGTLKDIAYQALENLAFDQLDGVLESRANGRLGLILNIRGHHDPAKDTPSRIRWLDLLRGRIADVPLSLPKGTPVNLTLDTSINFDDLVQSLSRPESGPHAGSAPQKP